MLSKHDNHETQIETLRSGLIILNMTAFLWKATTLQLHQSDQVRSLVIKTTPLTVLRSQAFGLSVRS